MKVLFSIFAFIFCLGCTMQRLPAAAPSVGTNPSHEFLSCDFHTFQDINKSLLPSIRLIDCSVDHDLAPEEVEFEFTHRGGELFGKQTGKLIDDVNLETGEHGVTYYLNYSPVRGMQDSLGRWCCWNINSNIPSHSELLPDELHAVHVDSDGGMVYRASWNVSKKQQRGLAMILCGLGGMQHSSRTLGEELLRDGWAVVYVFTVLNVPEYSMRVTLDGEPTESVIEIFNEKYCQVIAATKAIRTRMEKQLPSLRCAPLALIGISAGALNTPAVFHELQDDVDAIVLVAGGANMFDIVQDGVFTSWKFTNSDGNKFSKKDLQAMNSEYLNTPSRDPYFLAPHLPHDKTLIIHAKWDEVVPSENGDLLYERAGKPERWVYPSGHLGLFATFGWHAPEIVNWINSKIVTPSDN